MWMRLLRRLAPRRRVRPGLVGGRGASLARARSPGRHALRPPDRARGDAFRAAHPDRGTIRIRGEMENQEGVTVMSMVSRGRFARRSLSRLQAMSELGLFPLGIVLLPTEQIPLHIFEDRYQELIGECLDLEQRVRARSSPTTTGLREVGTRALVTEVLDRFDDGRLNIVVEGGERFRLVQLTEGRSFQTGPRRAVGGRSGCGRSGGFRPRAQALPSPRGADRCRGRGAAPVGRAALLRAR